MDQEQVTGALWDRIQDLSPGHRSFFVTVDEISISWSWKKNQERPVATINGKAKSEHDGVRALDGNKIYKEFQFQLNGKDDIGELWQKEKELRNSVRKITAYKTKQNIMDAIAHRDSVKDRHFDAESPTARLYILEPAREFRFSGSVEMHCLVPDYIFQKILQDFLEKKSSILKMNIKWFFEYIEDRHISVNFSTNWVLLKYLAESSLEPLLGNVEELNWH
jgi:hypothetical protein